MSSSRSLVEEFLTERSCRVSKETVTADASFIRQFFEFLESREVDDIAAITEAHLAEYCLHLRGRSSRTGNPLSTSFIARSLSVAKSFLMWAEQRGFVLFDFSNFPVTRPLQKLVEVPSIEQVRRLLEAPTVNTPDGFRDTLLYEFFYTLGLRAKECLRLNLEHVDAAAGTVKVHGKGSRERLLPMSPRLVELMTRYLKEGRPGLRPHPDETALWISPQTGRRLGYSTMKQRLAAYGDLQGLKVHPHLLRHACATHLLEAGADVESISALLGHKRADSTAHYARVSSQELASEFGRCHPRAGS